MALTKFFSVILIGVVLLLVLLTAISINGFLLETSSGFAEQSDIFYKMFGQLRGSIAAMLYLKADRYFHGGTYHEHGSHVCLGKDTHMEGTPEHHDDSPHHHDDFPHHENEGCGIFGKISRAIKYRPVHHLNDVESAEIMPWFELASIADPHYIQAYIVGGYWLGMRLGKPERALRFLKKGLKYNPSSWQIYAQMGDVYFFVKRDYQRAIAYFRQAYFFMRGTEVAGIEKKHVLVLLAASFEKLKDYGHSLQYYKLVQKTNVRDGVIRKKIETLEKLYQKDKGSK